MNGKRGKQLIWFCPKITSSAHLQLSISLMNTSHQRVTMILSFNSQKHIKPGYIPCVKLFNLTYFKKYDSNLWATVPTCVLVFVPEQRAALLESFFTDVTSIKPLVCLLESFPPWPSVSLQTFIHQREVVQSSTAQHLTLRRKLILFWCIFATIPQHVIWDNSHFSHTLCYNLKERPYSPWALVSPGGSFSVWPLHLHPSCRS